MHGNLILILVSLCSHMANPLHDKTLSKNNHSPLLRVYNGNDSFSKNGFVDYIGHVSIYTFYKVVMVSHSLRMILV